MTEFQAKLVERLESEFSEGIDRAAVARRLGVSVGAIANWLRGLWPRPQTHAALARFLRVPPSTMAAWFPEEERRRRQAGNKPAPVEAA